MPGAISATGFDAIVIKGKADGLTTLEIIADGAIFHNASDLKDKDTFETEDIFKQKRFNKKQTKYLKKTLYSYMIRALFKIANYIWHTKNTTLSYKR